MKKINILDLRNNRETWKELNTLTFSEDNKIVYETRKKAVDSYIDGVPLKNIENNTGIVSTEIIRYVRRCAEKDKYGKQYGYSALIPNRRRFKSNGIIEKLFASNPVLKEFIVGNYFGDYRYTLERNMNVKTLHSKLLKKCTDLGIQDYEYPFCTKDKGYSALYRYVKKLEKERQDLGIKRIGAEEKKKYLSTGFGETMTVRSVAPYDTFQIDGHKIDLLYSVETETGNGEMVLMPATRCWLIAVIDVATRAIIGYSISAHENYNQFDVIQALINSIVPHKKMEFSIKSLQYPDNGGFPTMAIPETKWAVCNNLMLDNAKSHLSKLVTDRLSNDLGIVLNYGSVATPEVRGIVERFFGTLERQGFHRIPGTTGFGVDDIKRNSPEKECAKYKITYSDICELMEYLIAEYNNSAHSSLENLTPLQYMESRIRNAGMTPSLTPETEKENVSKLNYFSVERTLRGGYNTGTKPRVYYLGLQYHSCDSALQMSLVGKKVIIEVNPDDISHVDLYDSTGIYLTKMVATGEWGQHTHSLKSRQASLKRSSDNKSTNSTFCPDLTGFENELRERGKKSRRSRTMANIMKEEEKKDSISTDCTEDPSPTARYHEPKKIVKNEQYTEEERNLIDSMSIEEAYKKGLI